MGGSASTTRIQCSGAGPLQSAGMRLMKRLGKERQPSPPSLPEATGISFLISHGFYFLIGHLDPEECGLADEPRLSTATVEKRAASTIPFASPASSEGWAAGSGVGGRGWCVQTAVVYPEPYAPTCSIWRLPQPSSTWTKIPIIKCTGVFSSEGQSLMVAIN